MIQPCNFLAPNGDKSELGQALIEQHGPERALSIWDNLHSSDVLEHIHDWKTDPRWNTEKGELKPEVATYVHNVFTARNEWNKLRSDATLGEMKLRREYNRDAAERLEKIYDGARIVDSKDTYGRSMYKVTIPLPKFQAEVAERLTTGETVGSYADALTVPGQYITPEIPDKEISTDILNKENSIAIAAGKETYFVHNLDHGLAQQEKAMMWVGGKPFVVTNEGKNEQNFFKFSVRNPYSTAEIASQELGIDEHTNIPGLASNSPQLAESLSRMFAQVRDDSGKPTGKYFTPEQQNGAVDAVLTDLYGYLRNSLKNGDSLTGNLLLSGLKVTQAKLGAFNKGLIDVVGGIANENFAWSDMDPQEAAQRVAEISNVLRSYDQVAGFVMERLRAYGFNIRDNIRENITDYLNRTTTLTDEENRMETPPTVEEGEQDIQGTDGQGLKDWSDSPFELDPRDTASKRMKFFLATIKDSEFGTEEAPKRVRMIFSDPELVKKIANGTKVYTVRTPDQADRIKLGADGKGSVVLDGKTFTVEAHKLLKDESDFANWQDVAEQEKITLEPNSVVYKLSEFKPRENVLVNKKSALGFPRLAPFDEVFTDTLARVQAATDLSYTGFRDALVASGSPTMMRVAQELEASDQQLKNEFFKVMSKQYYRMRIMLFNNRIRGDEQQVSGNLINANRFNEIDTLINGWREGQKISPIIIDHDGRSGVNQELAQKHFDQFQKISGFNWAKATEKNLTDLQSWTKNFLSDIGINMSDEAIKDFRTNSEKLTKGSQFAGSWLKQYSMTTDGKPNGVISALVMRLTGLAQPDSQIDEERNPEEDFLRNNNPLYTENTALRILAKSQAKFTPQLFTDMHKNSEGKNIYAYGLHTYQSHTFDSLKNDSDYRSKYQDIPFAKRSWLLSKLQSAEQREKIELNYLDGIKAAFRKGGGTTRPDMSAREQELTALLAFQNRGNKYATFFDMTKSDKSTTPVTVNVEKTPVKSFALSQEMSKHFVDVFESEFERVKHWEDNKSTLNNARYKKGGGLFYMLPQFNFEEMRRDWRSGKITEEQFRSVWNENGTISRTEDVIARNQIAAMYTGEFVRDMARATTARWRKMGIFNDEVSWMDQSWLKKARGNLAITEARDENNRIIPGQYLQVKGGIVISISKARVNELTASLAALEYSTNYFLHNTSMSQLISGDPALAYKGKSGTAQIDQVRDTMKEYQKRLAKDIGPGSDPAWDRNETYRSLTMVDPQYKSYLGDFIPGYKSFDTAGDAQELTTTQEHIYTMFKQGLIPDKTYHEMSDIIKSGLASPSKYYEFTKPEHLDIVLQPQKPVQVGNDFNNGVMDIHYIKTSSYPLLPQLTAGKEIDMLRQHMETGNIQRAVFGSGKKIGSPTEAANVFDSEGKFIAYDTERATQTITRAGFRIQQEVPYDETKEKILTVSQMNKLIVEGIESIPDFKMPGDRTLDGAEMKALKEDTRRQMFDIERRGFLKSIGAEESDQGYTFATKGKLFKQLEQEAISRNYPPNDLDAIRTRLSGDRLVLPLFLNGSADRFESLMMSMVKGIVALKMPGKSFIQASSLGYKGSATFESLSPEQKSGIIYTEDHDPNQNLRSMQKGDDTSKPAQVLVPFNFFGKDGRALSIDKFTKTTEDGRKVIDPEKLPDELRRFVGARIPNQEHSSMLPIEIVGFIPKQLGDLMIVPAEITQQMGSDFDVDKLYVYKPNYSYADGKLSTRNMIQAEGSGMDMKQLQQQYFDIHWGILTHKDMFNRVLEPLDKPELKAEKDLAEARNPVSKNYYDVSNQLDDFSSQKDAKTLVGATAVNNTFNALVQDKDLRLGYMEVGESGDGTREVPVTIDFKDEVTGEPLQLTRVSGTGVSRYYPKEDPSESDQSYTRTKANNISSQLSEVVDHAKNRTIDFLNFNQYTYPASAAMTILETIDGKALNLKYNSRLLQQEIIKEYADRMAAGNDSMSQEYVSDLKDKVTTQLLQEYGARAGDSLASEEPKLFSPQNLLKLLDTPQEKKDTEYYADQYRALQLFARLEQVGTTMRQIQSKFNQDTRGAGVDLLASLNTQADLPATFSNGVILGVDTMAGQLDLNPKSPDYGILQATTEAGHTYKNTVEIANGLYPEVLPYHKIQDLYGSISTEMGRDKISVDNQRRIADAVRSSLFSDSRNGLYQSSSFERARLLYDTEAGPSLARRVAELQAGNTDNYFLTRLATHLATNDGQESTITYNATGASSLDDFEVVKAWAGLLTSPDEAQRALGEDLIRYTYATGGMQTAQNFAKFVPIGYLAGLPMAHELNNRVETLEREVVGPKGEALKQQIFQHNPDMAMQLKPDFSQVKEFESLPKDRAPEKFTLDYDVTNTDMPANSLLIPAIGPEGKPIMRYPDFLSVRSQDGYKLYKVTEFGDGEYIYSRVDTLGKGDILEYDANRGYNRSIFPENRALQPLKVNPREEIAKTPAEQVWDENQTSNVKSLLGLTTEGQSVGDVLNKVFYSRDVSNGSKNLLSDLYKLATVSSRTIAGEEMPLISMGDDPKRYGAFTYDIATKSEVDPRYVQPRITINTKLLSGEQEAADTIIHEMTHYNTSLVLKSVDAFKSGKIDRPSWYGKDMESAINSIDALRARALEVFGDHKDPSIKYALGSNEEFIAGVFSNREFQRALDTIQDGPIGDKSLLSRVIDNIREIIRSVSEFLGVPATEGSALDEALRSGTIIMGAKLDGKEPTVVDYSEPKGPSGDDIRSFVDEMRKQDGEPGTEHSPEITKALGNLTTLLNKVKSKHILPSSRKMNEEEAREYQLRGAEINRLQYEIGKLQARGTLNNLVSIGSRQMKTIDGMLTDGENLSTKQLENMLDTADTWEQMVDNLYEDVTNGEVPKEAQLLRGQAAERKARIMNLVKQNEILDPESVIQGLSDFTAEKMQTNSANAYGRDLSRTSSLVAQQIDNYMKRSVRIEQEETRRTRGELSEYQSKVNKYAKLKGISKEQVFEKLLQKDGKWGLVKMFSDEYYNFKRTQGKSLAARLVVADAIEDPITRKQMLKDAYSKYRDNISKNVVYVDTSYLFDDKTGELLDTPTAKSHKAMLDKELSPELADTMVAKAKEQFQDYLRDRYSYKSAIQVQVQSLLGDYEEQLANDGGLTDAERSERVEEYKQQLTKQFNEEYNTWEGHNSPNVFFRSLRGEYKGFNPKFNNFGAIVDAPRVSAEGGKFYDTRYKDVQMDPDLRDIYNFVQQKMDVYKAMLPAYVTQELSDSFLPIVKSEPKLALSLSKIGNVIASKATDAISMPDGQVEYSRMDTGMIPIRYTNSRDIPVEERDRDIFRLLEKFGNMALHYNRASEVQSGVELLHRIMVDKINDTKGGQFDRISEGTKHLSDMVAYAKDRLIYQKSHEAEGELGDLYSLNPLKQRKLEKQVVDIKAQIEALDIKYAEGGIEVEVYNKQKQTLMERLDGIPHNQLLASKLGDVMIKMTQLKTLSYNPFSAFANVSFGMVSLMIHANGQTDFNKSAAMEAFTTMLQATKRAVTFGASDSGTAKKILALMERYNVMGDLLDTDFAGESRIQNRKSLAAKLASPYQLLRNSDYFMKGSILVAMMKTEKVTVDGKEIKLWDAYDNDGKWKGEDPTWQSEHAEDESEFRRFQAKAIQVSKTIMGNQDHASPMMIKKTVLGRMIAQFRATWLGEGFGARFENERYDSQLGRTVKGRYQTYKDLGVIGSMTTLFRQAMSTVMSVDPFTGKKRNGEALAPVDVENMRRNFAEVASYLTVMAAVVALKVQLHKDDPDSPEAKRNKAIGQTLLNMIIRNRQDIEFYASPDLFANLSSSLVPSMKVWIDFKRATMGTVKYMTQDADTPTQSKMTGAKVAERWARSVPYGAVYGKFKTMWSMDMDKLN